MGVFIASFLLLFKPFGLENETQFQAWIAFGFGAVTFVFASLFDLICRFIFRLPIDHPNWTLWKWVVQCLVLIAWIAFGNILFIDLLAPGQQLSFQRWLMMLPNTLLLGLFPIVFSGLMIQMRSEKSFVAQAEAIEGRGRAIESKQSQLISLSGATSSGDSQASSIDVAVNDLLMIEAMQNYMAVHVRGEDGEAHKHIVRSTLKELNQTLSEKEFKNLVQCHRSFIVNVDQVRDVSGNAQGLTLSLEGSDLTVPVSRKYIADIRRLL